jgi:hypothetical protein
MTKPQAIERFHLALLQVLPQHVPAANYAIKGGANLRLFLGSIRRSEDIDLNFVGRAGTSWSLQARMDAVLRSPALTSLLAVQGMKILSVNPSKVTATTGRWKFQMTAPGLEVSSKVEFSMRGEDRPLYQMGPVLARIASAAGMRPAIANHYLPLGAIEQKVAALALRSETQVRDVFDLDFLFVRFPDLAMMAQASAGNLDLARKRVFEATYADYLQLVVRFLDPAFVQMYHNKPEWERIVLNVATRLDAMRARTR